MRKMLDGSFLDFYRYMIDVAEMDFGALTDHQGGGHDDQTENKQRIKVHGYFPECL